MSRRAIKRGNTFFFSSSVKVLFRVFSVEETHILTIFMSLLDFVTFQNIYFVT